MRNQPTLTVEVTGWVRSTRTNCRSPGKSGPPQHFRLWGTLLRLLRVGPGRPVSRAAVECDSDRILAPAMTLGKTAGLSQRPRRCPGPPATPPRFHLAHVIAMRCSTLTNPVSRGPDWGVGMRRVARLPARGILPSPPCRRRQRQGQRQCPRPGAWIGKPQVRASPRWSARGT
jgi:hypothetical protein